MRVVVEVFQLNKNQSCIQQKQSIWSMNSWIPNNILLRRQPLILMPVNKTSCPMVAILRRRMNSFGAQRIITWQDMYFLFNFCLIFSIKFTSFFLLVLSLILHYVFFGLYGGRILLGESVSFNSMTTYKNLSGCISCPMLVCLLLCGACSQSE